MASNSSSDEQETVKTVRFEARRSIEDVKRARKSSSSPVTDDIDDELRVEFVRLAGLPEGVVPDDDDHPIKLHGNCATDDIDDELRVGNCATDDIDDELVRNDEISSRAHPASRERADHPILFSSVLELNPNEQDGESRELYYERTRFMPPKLYTAATTGNIEGFKTVAGDIELGGSCDYVSPRRDTILHLSARFGHDQLVKHIAWHCPITIKQVNYKGDLALHVAASGGHLSTVQALLDDSQQLAARIRQAELIDLLKKVNKEGNTPLHAALENRHQKVAEFLANKNPTVSTFLNREGKSPLCMATNAGYLQLVDLMIAKKSLWNHDNINPIENLSVLHPPRLTRMRIWFYSGKEKFQGKSLLHAAIMARNREVLEATLKHDEALIILSIDEEGRTPLSFAAFKGYLDVVCCLLDKSIETAYIRDRNGFFPIHMASSKGHKEIVHEFLKRCPDSRELLVDGQGQNILHVAAMYGRAKLVRYMLNTPDLEMLINERDGKGNTPLHLATMHCHPKVVSILTRDKKVRSGLVNNDGLTAMDVAQNHNKMMALSSKVSQNAYIETVTPFRKRLTVTALKSANAPRSEPKSKLRESVESSTSSSKSANAPQSEPKRDSVESSTSSSKPVNMEQYKDRVNILLLVSTLVATMAFAAGFTVPGGNNADSGTALLVTKPAFHAFFICNTIALYSSIIVVITLIFAQLGDLNLILTALKVAMPFLGVAVTMMSSAFMAGTHLLVSNRNSLAIVVLVLGSIFFLILLALFILLYSPISSHRYIARHVFYYPFCWMILVTRSDIENRKEYEEKASSID